MVRKHTTNSHRDIAGRPGVTNVMTQEGNFGKARDVRTASEGMAWIVAGYSHSLPPVNMNRCLHGWPPDILSGRLPSSRTELNQQVLGCITIACKNNGFLKTHHLPSVDLPLEYHLMQYIIRHRTKNCQELDFILLPGHLYTYSSLSVRQKAGGGSPICNPGNTHQGNEFSW